MSEREGISEYPESLPPIDDDREKVITLHGPRNLWSDACLGRLRLYDASGTGVELWEPEPYPAWQFKPGFYYIKMAVQSSEEERSRRSEPLPSEIMLTTIGDYKYVQVDGSTGGDTYAAFELHGTSHRDPGVLLHDITRIELIVCKEDAPMIEQYIDEPPLKRTD